MDHKWIGIYRKVSDSIYDGTYEDGSIIPSENFLAQKYGVHRLTARQALKTLESQGLIKGKQGRGYFVTKNETNIVFSIHHLFPNLKSTYKIDETTIKDTAIAQEFSLKKGDKIIHINVLRCNEKGEVIIYQDSYINPLLLKTDYSVIQIKINGIYKFLSNFTKYPISIARKKISFHENNEKGKFNIQSESLLILENRLYDIRKNQIEYAIYRFDPKNFKWEFTEYINQK